MADISLGDQGFRGTDNFPQGMIQGLVTALTGKNVTVTVQGTMVMISQGGTQIGSFDLQSGGREVWAAIADVLFSGASVEDIHVDDRIVYTEGYERGIDWRDMAESTAINENRYADGALTVAVNLAAFTITGFGAHFQKLIGIKLQRNDGNNSEGAMIETGLGNGFLRVNTSNEIQINTTVGSGTDTWVSLNDENGNITLASGADNFLIFEMVETVPGVATSYDVVGAFFNGSTYHQLNNVVFTPDASITGDNLGFSRSANQRGQITRFSAIDSSGYLTHNDLEGLLRHNQEDKWDFGFARLIAGSDKKRVDFVAELGLPSGSQIDGQPVAKFQRHSVKDNFGTPVSTVTLPDDPDWTDFDAIFLEMEVADVGPGGTDEVRSRYMSLATFKRSDIASKSIRVAGDRDITFNPTTRVITVAGNLQEITQCALIKLSQ